MKLRTLLLPVLLGLGLTAAAQAPGQVFAYAVGDWRDGPVVRITPLFETTEAFTTPQLIARVKKEHPAFETIRDIDVLRFATQEEGEESRRVLKAKYLHRGLEVDMKEAPPPAEK